MLEKSLSAWCDLCLHAAKVGPKRFSKRYEASKFHLVHAIVCLWVSDIIDSPLKEKICGICVCVSKTPIFCTTKIQQVFGRNVCCLRPQCLMHRIVVGDEGSRVSLGRGSPLCYWQSAWSKTLRRWISACRSQSRAWAQRIWLHKQGNNHILRISIWVCCLRASPWTNLVIPTKLLINSDTDYLNCMCIFSEDKPVVTGPTKMHHTKMPLSNEYQNVEIASKGASIK